MGIVKNVFRRKARALLTIFGITIGVLALVVMGAMAEKLNLLVDGGMRYYAGKVIVTDAGVKGMFGAPLSLDKVAEIEDVDGVAVASASLSMMIDPDQPSNVGVPPMIMGTDFKQHGIERFTVDYEEGRELQEGDDGKVTLGSDIARKLKAEVGDTVTLRHEKFQVVGVAAKTLTAPDQTVVMTMADAQRLYAADLPATVRAQVDLDNLCTSVAVYPKKGVNAESLAKDIEAGVDGVNAAGPSVFRKQIGDQMKMINMIIFSVALMSLIVGGMSVVNTMTMAVAERTREIGIRKAIGAGTSAIVRQFIGEAGLIGLLGGASGLAIGSVIAALLNRAGEASGNALFLVSPRLALGSLGFAIALGMVSGLYPALHAARLNPVRALRYE